MSLQRYRRWFEYEKDAHALVLQSFATVPEGARSEAGFQKAIDLLAHIVAARRLWLHRFGVLETGPRTVEEVFPKNMSLDDLRARLEDMERVWSRYLEGLDDDDLTQYFEYRALEGARYRNRIEDLLAQLFGHSWYHRGQIASIVRSLGGEPAETDYVFWTRESLPG